MFTKNSVTDDDDDLGKGPKNPVTESVGGWGYKPKLLFKVLVWLVWSFETRPSALGRSNGTTNGPVSWDHYVCVHHVHVYYHNIHDHGVHVHSIYLWVGEVAWLRLEEKDCRNGRRREEEGDEEGGGEGKSLSVVGTLWVRQFFLEKYFFGCSSFELFFYTLTYCLKMFLWTKWLFNKCLINAFETLTAFTHCWSFCNCFGFWLKNIQMQPEKKFCGQIGNIKGILEETHHWVSVLFCTSFSCA